MAKDCTEGEIKETSITEAKDEHSEEGGTVTKSILGIGGN
jgi:hypothetical protein